VSRFPRGSILDIVETFVQVSAPWAVCLSLPPTEHILGCLLLATDTGERGTRDSGYRPRCGTPKKASRFNGRKEGELVELEGHSEGRSARCGPYMVPTVAYFSALLPALHFLRHPHPSFTKTQSLYVLQTLHRDSGKPSFVVLGLGRPWALGAGRSEVRGGWYVGRRGRFGCR